MFSFNLRNAVARFPIGGRSGHPRSFSSDSLPDWIAAKELVRPSRVWLLRGIMTAGGAVLAHFTLDMDDSEAANEFEQKAVKESPRE